MLEIYEWHLKIGLFLRELADFTGDGKMDMLEFAIAMKFIKLRLQGAMLPSTLPLSMKQQPPGFCGSSYGMHGIVMIAKN